MIGSIVSGYSTGISYSKFSGPVGGPVKKIRVGGENRDYHFAYGVKDPKNRLLQSRQETRIGGDVRGEYR